MHGFKELMGDDYTVKDLRTWHAGYESNVTIAAASKRAARSRDVDERQAVLTRPLERSFNALPTADSPSQKAR